MNNNQPSTVKLPFWETIRRSFIYPFANFKDTLKISSFWFLILIYEIAAGSPGTCNITDDGCFLSVKGAISFLLILAASISIMVAFCRYTVLGEKKNLFKASFGLRELKYIGVAILIMLAVIVPLIALIAIFVFFLGLFGVEGNQMISYMLIPVLLTFIISIYVSRLYVALAAVTVDNKKLDFRKALRLTAGNANRIFWGQLLLILPMTLSIYSISTLYSTYGGTLISDILFVVATYAITFLDSSIKASFLGHIYMFFNYFDKRDI